jgi:hypothetical protein
VSIPRSCDFYEALVRAFGEAERDSKAYIDVNSGNLHRRIGGYPGKDHRMPLCCEVMLSSMKAGDSVLKQPPRGKGASLTIRYKLTR